MILPCVVAPNGLIFVKVPFIVTDIDTRNFIVRLICIPITSNIIVNMENILILRSVTVYMFTSPEPFIFDCYDLCTTISNITADNILHLFLCRNIIIFGICGGHNDHIHCIDCRVLHASFYRDAITNMVTVVKRITVSGSAIVH